MKRPSFILTATIVALFFVTKAPAGNLTVNGNLTVTTNLTAQSISLGGVTQTSWPGAVSQGYKYIIVSEGTNDLQRGSNLQTAYTTATTMGPMSSNRVVVLVPPGNYNLGSSNLVMNTSYVDLMGLVPAQMTSKQLFTAIDGSIRTKTVANIECAATIYSTNSAGTIVQNVDCVRIESVILTNTSAGWAFAYYPTVAGSNTVLRHVALSSMRWDAEYAGTYFDCVGGTWTFGYGDGLASGTFIECVAGSQSFSGPSGTFIDCTAGGGGFGHGVAASGTFVRCVGDGFSFGTDVGTAGTFIDCVAGDSSFGALQSVSGTFINCIGGFECFGGGSPDDGYGTLETSAKLQHCKAGPGSFGSFSIASDDFNYNVGGANTFLILPQLPTNTNGLPSGTVYNSSGTLKVMP